MNVAGERKRFVGPVLLANGSNPKDWEQDACFIEGANVEKDTLHVSVSYTGGCAEHNFRLVAWNYFSEDDTAQAKLLLAHNANGDACKAIVKEQLYFDILPLKAEYQTIKNSLEPGTMLLCLQGLNMEYYL